ncbi:hypothetical protein [Nostoc sp. CMAA1605]|uniref:hypothetical protein n=1 Tax=Nostoc sp. CMAA1605 TaxID=2055159 RepID=UPI001F377E4E|nr:hypothetical protein [Nostoc sp. CMAA1605]MCF4967555.1 hypothetical protein [Nostoc sp. CMAA1605]
MPENHQSQNLAKGILAGAFILTGFAPLNAGDAIASQLAKSLEKYLLPVAEANVGNPIYIAQSPEEFVSLPEGNTLYIEGSSAVIVNKDGEQKLPPDGYYRLSIGAILKIESGKVTYSSSRDFDPNVTADVKWKLCSPPSQCN